MGIYKILLNQVLIPKDFRHGLLPVDHSVDRARSRSTGRSIDVHKMCTAIWLVARSTGRLTVQRALLSESGPGRPGGQPVGQCPVSIDRPVDCFPNGRKSDRWRSTGRSTDRRIFFCIFPNGYIRFCLFLGLFPTTLLGFYSFFHPL